MPTGLQLVGSDYFELYKILSAVRVENTAKAYISLLNKHSQPSV